LGHNSLSDDGCVLLFAFLSSPLGRKYPIAEISLNANRIGDRGLSAIAAYLLDNTHLTELFLQDNLLTANPSITVQFAHAVNRSRLRSLSLTTNHLLSDDWSRLFFESLCSRYLQELHISAIGLTQHSAPYIADFLASADRCHLQTLKCNGNSLAFRGVRSIVRAIERANFSLTAVELYSNNITSGQDSEDTDDDVDGETQNYGLEAWKDNEKLTKQVLARNSHLKRETGREALQLLVYSRAVLLRPKQPFIFEVSASSPASTISFPFRDFPTEIQLYILSFLAPTLSASQRIRIYDYASSPLTLPALLPTLPSTSGSSSKDAESSVFAMCVPDPSVTMGFAANLPASPVWTIANSGGGGCAPGKCLGTRSLLCHLEKRRSSWLEQVGCLAYDAGDGER